MCSQGLPSPDSHSSSISSLFSVAKKADSIYPSVSAASICAKVTRDQILENWNFVENGLNESASRQFGSGYPGDQKTIRWLKESLDKIFGFPRIIRFSWQTTEKMLDENCVKVKW